MQLWNGWPLERLLYISIAAAFLVLWLQVGAQTRRTPIKDRFLQAALLYTPLLVLAAALMSVFRGRMAGLIFVCVYAIGVLEALLAGLLPLLGSGEYSGRYQRALNSSAPMLRAALAYAALCTIGLGIYFWPSVGLPGGTG